MLYAVYRGISDIYKIKLIFVVERQIPEAYFELFRTPTNTPNNPLNFLLVSKSLLQCQLKSAGLV